MGQSPSGKDWCAGPDPRLAAFLDGELPLREQRQLENHLQVCARCQADLAQQRSVQLLLRQTAATSLGDCDRCAAPDPRLAALLDGELSPSERQQLEDHLKLCARCRADLVQQRSIQLLLRQTAATLTPSPALRAKLNMRTSRAGHRSRRRGILAVSGLAAVIALFALTGFLFWASQGPSAVLFAAAVRAHQSQTLGDAPVAFASADSSAVASWARQQTGKSFDVPDLEPVGYRLLGARIQPDVGPRAVALVYEGAAGRLTCTILPADAPSWLRSLLADRLEHAHAQEINGAGLATWADEDSAYVMVANVKPAALLPLARFVAANSH
jgi:anti-sigma factor RsiW